MEIQAYGAKSEPSRYSHLRGPTTGPVPLLDWLAEQKPEIGRERLKWLIEFGAVYIDGFRATDPNAQVSARHVVRVHWDPKRYQLDRAVLQNRIIAETRDYLVVNKPSGLPMHPTLDNLHENLISGFEMKLYVTHRLDVPTSGVVLVAKTKEYQALFNRVVANRGVGKLYQVFTQRPVPAGVMEHFMKATVSAPKEVVAGIHPEELRDSPEKWARCLLRVLTCGAIGPGIFESRVELITGRTHQIRAQFSAMGAPLIGDEMYGGVPSKDFGLHACALSFVCPKTEESLSFTSYRVWGQ